MNKLFGYIQNYEEAVLMVHATRLGYITPITQRLKTEEREGIRSGDIFVFVETENGIKRWTDGKIWSPSKIHGQFLLYKEVPRHLSKSAIKKRNAQNNNSDAFMKLTKELKEDDKLSFHKKTISLVHQDRTYHVIGYYRPLFSKEPLINIPFFKKIETVLRSSPELMDDDFLNREMKKKGFYKKYRLPEHSHDAIFPEMKRLQLENIALCVLNEWMAFKKRDILKQEQEATTTQ